MTLDDFHDWFMCEHFDLWDQLAPLRLLPSTDAENKALRRYAEKFGIALAD
jgi:hypothetical protein